MDQRKLFIDCALDGLDIRFLRLAKNGSPAGFPAVGTFFLGKLVLQSVENKRLDGLSPGGGAGLDLTIHPIGNFYGRFHDTIVDPYLWFVKPRAGAQACRN